MFPTALVLAAMMFDTYVRLSESLPPGVHRLVRAIAGFLLVLNITLGVLLVISPRRSLGHAWAHFRQRC